ncbi:MAG: phosphoglycerate mutase, partial [Candidatus Bathyarchaeia archaeon]
MKAVLIVCDGLGDRPVSQLNGKTPLQAARRRALDALARGGINGLMHTISPGRPPGSDTGHLAIFGYDPHAVYSGRGAFEAIGAGLSIQPGDVAFRCNFATVDENWRVTDRRAGRISTADARQLADSLKGGKLETHPNVQILFAHSTEHRGALIMRGGGLSSEVSDS